MIHAGDYISMSTNTYTPLKVGDVCEYWNKLVIIHTLDEDSGWAEILKVKNPERPNECSGQPMAVRVNRLTLYKSK